MPLTREIFDAQRRPRFGTANPERMQLEFWEWMIWGHFFPPRHFVKPSDCLQRGAELLAKDVGWVMRGGYFKSVYGPWRARDLFQIPLNREEGPIWNFDRMGRTSTTLPDGRTIHIAGEHEDSYDPDFYIYNDVVVISRGPVVEIFGYPRDIFQPTDFHTATLVGERILLIGCFGNFEDRRLGYTPVYSLDICTYQIARIETSGEMPGWISQHKAEFQPPGTIALRGGKVLQIGPDGKHRLRRNLEDYELDLDSLVWRRSSNRNWRRFVIRQADGRAFDFNRKPAVETLRPYGIEHSVAQDKDTRDPVIVVEGVPFSIAISREIEIAIQGDLREELGRRVAEIMCCMAEEKLAQPCVLEGLPRTLEAG